MTEARATLAESAQEAQRGAYDPAYRRALASRNLLFHAERGLAAARAEPLPEMPVVGAPGGSHEDHLAALAALDRALGCADDRDMVVELAIARPAYARYLGWLRGEVARELSAKGEP